MEVPKDYVLDIIKQMLNNKIDATEYNLRFEITDLKTDISDLKSEIKDFHKQCRYDMGKYDKRLISVEEFKIKVLAIAGAVGTLSAFIFSVILK